MQNEPNLPKAQMNVNKVLTKDYENKPNWTLGENEPKTNPIKANSKPIKANIKPIQTQYKAKQSQFQTAQNAAACKVFPGLCRSAFISYIIKAQKVCFCVEINMGQ